MIGLDGALELAEVSEWLDWMRTELAAGGVDLPGEKTSVLFAINSVRYADRVRSLCRHLPDTLRSRLIQAGILYQCWKRQRELCGRARAPVFNPHWPLQLMPAVRCITKLDEDGKPWFEGADGFRYVATCIPRPERKYAPATHCLCAEFARRLGLPVPPVTAILVEGGMRRELEHAGLLRNHSQSGLLMAVRACANPEFSGGIKQEPGCWDPGKLVQTKVARRAAAYRLGGLIFDILTLNLMPKPPVPLAANPQRAVFMDQSHCFMDANWSGFLSADYKEPLQPAWEAVEVRNWASLEHWLQRIDALDVHPLWELAFQLPPEWYANDRILITKVLEKLASRCWDVRRTLHYLVRAGRFPNLPKDSRGASEPGPSPALQRERVS